MKEKKFIIMISSILGVMLLLFMVFELAAIFNTTLTESSNRSLEISIALFSMFATFGGAYLGAKISGQYAIRLSNQQFLITYSDELLKYLIRVEDIIQDIRKGITDNICKLDELKQDMSSEKELVTFYDYYSALLEIYLHIQMCNMYVGLDKKLIYNLKPPTQLLALAYDNTSQLVNTKENGDKELNEDYQSYDDALRITNTIIIKMQNHIINLEEEMIGNFDKLKKTYI
ncbi:hypothetical protein [Staphylococcus argenteus]|uniref:hypothetical protein n=1 Tax=Staphylococcus argenteus TaxID=985002 RepID=UPI001FBB7CBC|nr:hypothetical protein [Staphylococcus argenteus]MCG9795732.1 hypothetical protein [Staphylococcus argenteus]GJF44966.1 hypothetical protein SA19061_20560 [Staphylococcus argenteus]GJF53678.1 hypothetical protein SA19088_04210 [Staphylococcus argenteus]GJF60163.1 hypothetical protein SA19105_16510 [Staphylococcus argenteus]GJF73319.1 hypothetical protein SA19202_19270 [Staphylococcus argenteus]